MGEAAGGQGPEAGHGVSVKLSALSPRYEATPGGARLRRALSAPASASPLAAAEHDINLTLDAEEADRLVLSLKLLDRLAREPALGDWRGLGLAVQAYQKRGAAVIDAGRRAGARAAAGG